MPFSTIDESGEKRHVSWLWILPASQGGGLPLLKRLPEPIAPLGLILAVPLAWVLLTTLVGPEIIAVSLFSPVSTTFIFTMIMLALWVRGALKRHASRCMKALLVRSKCPACRYDLTGAQIDTAGVISCPECAATWNTRASTGPIVVASLQRASSTRAGETLPKE